LASQRGNKERGGVKHYYYQQDYGEDKGQDGSGAVPASREKLGKLGLVKGYIHVPWRWIDSAQATDLRSLVRTDRD